MRNFALVLIALPTAAVRLGGTPAMQVYTPLIAPERRKWRHCTTSRYLCAREGEERCEGG